MISGRYATRLRKHGGYGPGLAKYCKQKIYHPELVPCSMAVVQSVLLYRSKSWNLSVRAMARLEGFNIRVGYRMAVVNKPRRGLHHTWVYPRSKDVLNECGMQTISHFIGVRRDTILAYVVNRPIYQKCREGERKRGSAPRQWWWEQPMQLYNNEAVEQ